MRKQRKLKYFVRNLKDCEKKIQTNNNENKLRI